MITEVQIEDLFREANPYMAPEQFEPMLTNIFQCMEIAQLMGFTIEEDYEVEENDMLVMDLVCDEDA